MEFVEGETLESLSRYVEAEILTVSLSQSPTGSAALGYFALLAGAYDTGATY
jgi:hypothetical protein